MILINIRKNKIIYNTLLKEWLLDRKDTIKESSYVKYETIINNLIADEKAEDANLLFKSLINLRKEKNIKFNDTVMAEKYSQYCKQYK